MPCFNEQYTESVYANKNYEKKVFSYVGSLAKWQCFEETVDLYKSIESKVSGTFFKVLTFNVDEAKEILKSKGIKNYSVACVPKERVFEELKDVTYGFIVRKDSVVNNVATPTKFSSYMSAGVIPIFSSCLKDFAVLSDKIKYAKKIGELSESVVDDIVRFVKQDINVSEIKKEYKSVFDTYYNKDVHRNNISTLLKKLL